MTRPDPTLAIIRHCRPDTCAECGQSLVAPRRRPCTDCVLTREAWDTIEAAVAGPAPTEWGGLALVMGLWLAFIGAFLAWTQWGPL